MDLAHLKPDELAHLMQTMDGGAATTAERRRHSRSEAHRPIPVTLRPADSAPTRVTLHDLSRSGIGVHSRSPLPVGQTVDVQVHSGAKPVRANCRVATCRLLPDGLHLIGLEFQSIARPQSPTTETPAPPPACSPAGRPDDPAHVDSVATRLAAELDRA